MTEDRRGRLERALDMAPLVEQHVNALSLDERDELARMAMTRSVLPDLLVTELAELPEPDRERLIELRYAVAATDPHSIRPLDSVLLAAAASGMLAVVADRFAALMQANLGSTAVELLEAWYDEQMGNPPAA